MKPLLPESILSGTKHAQINTWGGRYNKTVPSITRNGSVITYSTSLVSVDISAFDEIVLTIIMKFLFVPVWLVKQFYQSEIKMVGNEDYVDEMVHKWIKLGIVWKESEVTGQYLRPTYALFQMFQQPPYRYCNIPFNTLRHTICEEKVMFDVMSGASEIIEKEKVMPRVSELGFEGKLSGTNVIAEEDFRNPSLFGEYRKIMDVEYGVNEGMKRGSKVTPELQDFRYFNIVKKVDNTGNVKSDFKFHVPDLIIPVIRDKGKPMSIAIEIELSNKRVNYVESMERYKDNNKFGVVYWLCATPQIATYLREAYEQVGGTGSCRTELLEFIIPFPEF